MKEIYKDIENYQYAKVEIHSTGFYTFYLELPCYESYTEENYSFEIEQKSFPTVLFNIFEKYRNPFGEKITEGMLTGLDKRDVRKLSKLLQRLDINIVGRRLYKTCSKSQVVEGIGEFIEGIYLCHSYQKIQQAGYEIRKTKPGSVE